MQQLNSDFLKNNEAFREKVIQFGTGVLLRGLPDTLLDEANKKGLFGGRILVVKSTDGEPSEAFSMQDGLYTLAVRGLEDGALVDQCSLNSAISRVLSADAHWLEILEAGTSPNVEFIVSNTTEVGIVLHKDDDLYATPPRSFPAKLTALLLERFRRGGAMQSKGYVILPTELISNNGDELRRIILELAVIHQLGNDFIAWVKQENYFCNTLVDRIVPGALAVEEKAVMEVRLGYRDELMIVAEPYRLWAIETNDDVVKDRLAFAMEVPGMVLSPDIRKFKELKLRLLNGTHSISCALAMLSGHRNVKTAMSDPEFHTFVSDVMDQEIIPAIVGADISVQEAKAFASSVVDRFSNPFLDHQWASISLNYTSKIAMRCVPVIKTYAERTGKVPRLHALGFAAYLWFIKTAHGLKDERAPFIQGLWQHLAIDKLVDTVLYNMELWSERLDDIPGFAAEVKKALRRLSNAYAIKEVIDETNES